MNQKSDSRCEPPALDEDIQRHIGRHLRAMFERVAAEPVPDRFVTLLEQLEATAVGQETASDSQENIELTK
jgi:hypothetical protein